MARKFSLVVIARADELADLGGDVANQHVYSSWQNQKRLCSAGPAVFKNALYQWKYAARAFKSLIVTIYRAFLLELFIIYKKNYWIWLFFSYDMG